MPTLAVHISPESVEAVDQATADLLQDTLRSFNTHLPLREIIQSAIRSAYVQGLMDRDQLNVKPEKR